jgi:hypothetical protein
MLLPTSGIEGRPMHEGEVSVLPWGDVPGQQRSLNRDCSGTTKWIDQWSAPIPSTRQQHGSSQGFTQRSFGDILPIAAPVQQLARCIGTNSHIVMIHTYHEELYIRHLLIITTAHDTNQFSVTDKWNDSLHEALRNGSAVVQS